MTSSHTTEQPSGPARDVAGRAAPRTDGRRRKFDKVASTTVLLAALVGLGAGAAGRLVVAERLTGPSGEPTVGDRAAAPTLVIVVDASGRVLATYEDASLVPVSRTDQSQVSLTRGPARSARASTRAS